MNAPKSARSIRFSGDLGIPALRRSRSGDFGAALGAVLVMVNVILLVVAVVVL